MNADSKILIIQTAFIGDVVLATSLVEKINGQYPGATIHFLLRRGNEGLLKDHPLISKLLILDKQSGKYWNLMKMIKTIRHERYDYVVNVQRFFTTGLLTALSGAKTKIGFKKNPLSWAFNIRVDHLISENGMMHEIDRNHKLIESFTDRSRSLPRLYPRQNDFRQVPAHKFVCLAPASVWFTKQFPKSNWIDLINLIPPECAVLLIGEKAISNCVKKSSNSQNIRALISWLGN